MSKVRSLFHALVYGRFSLLLFFLVLMFLVLPLIPIDRVTLNKTFDLLGLVIILSCLRGITNNHRFFIFMVILSIINVMLGGGALLLADIPLLQVIGLLFRLFYYILVFISIMRYVIDETPITSDKLAGALSSYILIGIIWTFIYSLFFLMDPANFSFSNPTISESHNWVMYFSFTTLTTLGYGDITPTSTAVQNYSVIEALFGQVFLAVVIARLVSLQILHKTNEK